MKSSYFKVVADMLKMGSFGPECVCRECDNVLRVSIRKLIGTIMCGCITEENYWYRDYFTVNHEQK